MTKSIFAATPEAELKLRWARVSRVMEQNGVEALIVSDNTSLLYMSGRIFSGVVYCAVGCDPIFFVRRPVGLVGEGVCYMRKVEDIPAALVERGRSLPRNIAFEGDVVTHNEFLRLSKIFALEPQNIYTSATTILRVARSVKTEFEIEQIRDSGRRHVQLYEMIPALFREGMSDNDIAIELEYHSRRLGSIGSMRIFGRTMEAFVGSILVGDNASAASPYDFALGGEGMDTSLPVGGNGSPILRGQSVMIDQGGTFNSYITDMTRVFSLGKLPDKAYRAHQVALDMQATMEEMVTDGQPTAEIYNMCIDMARRNSLSDCFMGSVQQAGFVGHGVGLEVNELPVIAPRSREHFEVGNVFAFEPKFVIEGVGAVGVENTYAVTNDGVEKLTLMEERIIPLEGADVPTLS